MKNPLFKILLFITILYNFSFSQNRTILRDFVPVIQETKNTALEGLVISDWQAYSYNVSAESWSRILYQVDERSQDGKYNKLELMDGVIGPYDEILIMPSDLGDKAPAFEWINGIDPADNSRIEIELMDMENAESGWIYLFNQSDISALDGHFRYIQSPAFNSAADTVLTQSYKIAHSLNGWIDYASLSSNWNMDLLDRLKLRLAGDPVIPLVSDYVITEDAVVAKSDDPKGPVTFIEGNIRSFEDRRAWFHNPIDGTKNTADYQMQFFPYSFRITLDKFPLNKNWLALLGVQSMRFSMDLNNNSAGMKFYSNNNVDGFPIDGTPDAVGIPLNPEQTNQWVMATGDAGSVLLLMEMPAVKNGTFDLYHRDNNSGGTNDNTDDTGDGASFSDMGLWVHVDDGHLDADFLSIKYNAYFINQANLNPAMADQIVQWETAPLQMTVTEQTFDASVVSQNPGLPEKFELSSAYPNPFKLGKGDIQFNYKNSGPGETVTLFIYNILGQKIAQQSTTLGETNGHFKWDGRSLAGEAVPVGIYFYQIETMLEKFNGKLVINK